MQRCFTCIINTTTHFIPEYIKIIFYISLFFLLSSFFFFSFSKNILDLFYIYFLKSLLVLRCLKIYGEFMLYLGGLVQYIADKYLRIVKLHALGNIVHDFFNFYTTIINTYGWHRQHDFGELNLCFWNLDTLREIIFGHVESQGFI